MAMNRNLGIVVTRPKYSKYAVITTREETFKHWTKTTNALEMARAGFVYSGKADITSCFYCGITLKDWPVSACPYEQHAIASPDCGHLIHCKGLEFIQACSETHFDSSNNDTCDVVDTVELSIKRNKEAVALAREYVLDEDLLKRSIKLSIRNDPTRKFTATDLVKLCQELDEGSSYDSKEESSEDNHEDNCNISEDLEQTNRRLKEPVMCKICYDAFACVVIVPCGHLAVCSQCVSALLKCAICRGEIKGTVRAVMAV
ncbi:hypothetical protein ACF0H5_015858 [Mactra antiquata]